MAEEKIVYQDNNVVISTTRFVIQGKTYVAKNVTSVGCLELPRNLKGAVFMIIAGGIIFLLSIALKQYALIIFAFLLIGGGITIISLLKRNYALVLTSTSQEQQALYSKDKDYILKISDSINEAIIGGQHEVHYVHTTSNNPAGNNQKFCSGCGNPYDTSKSGQFCGNCGTKL